MGFIYILTNPSFPDYVKIGYADNVEERLRQLNRSECTPFAFRVYATYKVEQRLTDMKIHDVIDKLNPDLRSIDTINGKKRIREFYAMSPEDAFGLFEAIAEINGLESSLKLWRQTEEQKQEETVANEIAEESRAKAKAFTFSSIGIKIGDYVEFACKGNEFNGTAVKVVDDKHVEYEETTGGECLVSFAQQYDCVAGSTVFSFSRDTLELTELFEKGLAIIAFGGYVHSNNKANVGIEISYKYEGRIYSFHDECDTVIEQNSWENVGFHVEQTINKDSRVFDVLVRMRISTEPGTCLNFISFDLDAVNKDEFTDTSCAKSFYQKTGMHVPYLYYLESDLQITQYLVEKYQFSKGLRVIMKSCNRCGRFLPINIDDEMRTLSFSLHCKKRAPCVHSTFRAYEIQNWDELSANDLTGLQIEDHKVVSYYGHQLECKACKKFFVNAPLNPQRNPQQHKEDSLRRRAIEVLVNTLLDRNLVHFEFEKRTKKEFSKYIWEKFDKKCFKCGPDSDPIELEDMALDHTLPLAYLYRLDESATCLCSSHNSQKSDHFPVDYYSEEELIRLSQITGLSLEQLHQKEVNQKVLDLLIEHVVWFYDVFLMEPDYQKKRDGIRTADKINDSLKRTIAGKIDLAEEYKRITGKYPTSVTIK